VLSSQEVKEGGKSFVRKNPIFLGIGSNLVCIHADHGDLDRTGKVVVIVAQMIGRVFKLILADLAGVVCNSEENWLGSSYSGLVWNKVEIISVVTLVFDKSGIHNSTRAWIQAIIILPREKSVLDVTVYEAVNNLGSVSLSCVFEQLSDQLDLSFLDFSSHGGASHAISVDHNLLWKNTIYLLIGSHGLTDKVFNDFRSLICGSLLQELSKTATLVLLPFLSGNWRRLLLI
jgi:hypothetical protein